ncbi:MAG: hypothetical protein ACREJB_06665, partial [Planctomycetaceae bacterium]
ARDFAEFDQSASFDWTWSLVRAGIRQTFGELSTAGSDGGHHAAIARAVLATFPANAFRRDGTFRPRGHSFTVLDALREALRRR